MSGKKQYGLITKKTNQPLEKSSVFGDDSDSDPECATNWVKKSLKANAEKVKRQDKFEIERALAEDATVFQYDEVYDEMERKKQESVETKVQDKKPKYIENLLKTAERRKIEYDRRIERQAQKEREEEGDEFKDKETFVTSAYKKKLEEFAKLDAEQKHQDYLEQIGDVTKQEDISGFYRHLYSSIVGNEKEKDKPDKSPPSVEASRKEEKREPRKYRERYYSASSDEKNDDFDTGHSSSSSSSSSSGSDSDTGKSSDSENDEPKKKRKKSKYHNEKPADASPIVKDGAVAPSDKTEPVQIEQPKPLERSIWEKRTVGDVFDSALKRYLERKAEREGTAVC